MCIENRHPAYNEFKNKQAARDKKNWDSNLRPAREISFAWGKLPVKGDQADIESVDHNT